jgi:hypothetical protein
MCSLFAGRLSLSCKTAGADTHALFPSMFIIALCRMLGRMIFPIFVIQSMPYFNAVRLVGFSMAFLAWPWPKSDEA